MKIYRHGDVLVKEIKKLPVGLKVVSNGRVNKLALGKVTGHSHRLNTTVDVDVWEDTQKIKYFSLKDGATLSHEEHATKSVDAGTYTVLIERERDPFNEALRKVVD